MAQEIRYLDVKVLARELDTLRDLRALCAECRGDIAATADGYRHGEPDEEQTPVDIDRDAAHTAVPSLDDDDHERLANLEALEKELGDLHLFAKKNNNVIAKDTFALYAEEQAYEAGQISRDSPVAEHVDWEGFAGSMGADFREVDFDGETWFYPA